MAYKNNGGKGKKVVSKSNRGMISAVKAFMAKDSKDARGKRGGGSKSNSGSDKSKMITAKYRLTQGYMTDDIIPDMPFRNLQAQRVMQDRPAALSAMKKEKPTKAQGYPNPMTKGGKVGYALTDISYKP